MVSQLLNGAKIMISSSLWSTFCGLKVLANEDTLLVMMYLGRANVWDTK